MGLNAEVLSFAVPSSTYLCELQPKAHNAHNAPVLTMSEEHTHQKPPGWLRAVCISLAVSRDLAETAECSWKNLSLPVQAIGP